MRSSRLLVAALTVGVLVPTAVSQTAVSAVEQDLVVSATSGAARTDVTVTSASCDTSFAGDTIRYLSVRFLSGTDPDQVLAGSAAGVDGDDATFVVPDWIDPAQPAVIEASCVELSIEDEDAEIPPVQTLFTYDPVPFDVETSPDAPVQARTYSRTSLQAGQAFAVAASGCFLEDATFSYVEVVAGSDLTFADPSGVYFGNEGEVEGGAFEVITALVNGGLSISVSGSDVTPETIEIEEVPTDIPAGTYRSITSCTNDAGASLLFEPQLIEVTGDAPFGEMDIAVPPGSRSVTVAGGSCTTGDVDALVYGEEFTDGGQDFLSSSPARTGSALRPAGATPHRSRLTAASALLGPGSDGRALSDEPVEQIVTPDANGSWTFTEDAGFDRGLVGAFALCGDPLEDGFLYDDRAAVVSVPEVVASTSTTTTTTAPPPVPANAVAGSPTYAG